MKLWRRGLEEERFVLARQFDAGDDDKGVKSRGINIINHKAYKFDCF